MGAKRGLPLLMAAAKTANIVARTQAQYRALLTEHGQDPRKPVLPVNRFIYVAESNEQAVAETRDLSNLRPPSYDHAVMRPNVGNVLTLSGARNPREALA